MSLVFNTSAGVVNIKPVEDQIKDALSLKCRHYVHVESIADACLADVQAMALKAASKCGCIRFEARVDPETFARLSGDVIGDPCAPMVLVEADTVAQSARLLSTGAYSAERLKARVDELLALEATKCSCGCNAVREGPGHVAGSARALVDALAHDRDARKEQAQKERDLAANARYLAEHGAPGTRPCTCGAMNCRRDHGPIPMDPAPVDPYWKALSVREHNRTNPEACATRPSELGESIARLPEPSPEPLAFLDEDLLCDDE